MLSVVKSPFAIQNTVFMKTDKYEKLDFVFC